MEDVRLENEFEKEEVEMEKMNFKGIDGVNWKDLAGSVTIVAVAVYGVKKLATWGINKWNAHRNKKVVVEITDDKLEENSNEN